ncbi:MAG: FKBP-type peptidyl-prolyl cis-trans isomerase N-terminal domain-containing protein, partial [Nitrospirota bacterium]
MKLRFMTVLSAALIAGLAVAAEKVELKTQKDKVSYSIGLDIGNNLKKQSVDINPDAFAKGLKDAFSGSKPIMTEQEIRDTMTAFQQEMIAKQLERSKGLGEKNKKEGEVFLAGNKKKEGVVTLHSGLQYRVIKEGDGKTPKATDTVTVNYRGALVDGTEFDSSYKRGEAAD